MLTLGKFQLTSKKINSEEDRSHLVHQLKPAIGEPSERAKRKGAISH